MSETPTAPAARPLRELVAEEVRAVLGRKRTTATALARKLGKSQTYMWRRLSGETAFDTDDLEAIATTLGVKVADLLPREVRQGGQTTVPNVALADRPRDGRPKSRSDRGPAHTRRPYRIDNPTPVAPSRYAA